MHVCIKELIEKIAIDDSEKQAIVELPSQTIEKGDATYMGIAAASIIAKVEHDKYISDLCEKYPILNERYGLEKNVGYGTKQHMDAVREHGITQWHRKSFAPRKGCPITYIQ
jgi:ribonuclease HII